MNLQLDRVNSPLGPMLVVTENTTLRALEFDDHEARLHRLLRLHYRTYTLTQTRQSGPINQTITDYFDGDLAAFDQLPIATAGTAFQRAVWAALRQIPPATTTSYGAIAHQIGRPTACRAVGLANGSNPITIVVPCHRVIGANAGLTGYGGGLERKAWLIDHERRHAIQREAALAV